MLSALFILGALAVLNIRPFTVSCHDSLLCPSKTRNDRVKISAYDNGYCKGRHPNEQAQNVASYL
jgi:hypothetical protein